MESHMSVQTHDIHQQMTRILIVQATVPLIVCFLPIGITLTMVFLRASNPGVGICVSLLLSWIPATNSTMTIIFVKSYRNVVIDFFHKCFSKNYRASVFAASVEASESKRNAASHIF
uniref:G protein-coupled receptor n=1 Tax=Panagrolaimus superbus TaxID=310955 RepID=A0A914ZAC3_9BILA